MRYNIQGIKPGSLVITFYQVDGLVNNRHSRKFQRGVIITHTFAVFGSPNPRQAFTKGVSTPKTPFVQIVFRPQYKRPSHRRNKPRLTLGCPTFCRKSYGTYRHPRKLTKPVPCVLASEAPSLDGGHSAGRAYPSRRRYLDGVSRAHSPSIRSPSHD